jgi:REP element-mobilizing transposase RayT
VDLKLQLVHDKEHCQRRSIRLKDYDYSQEGAYFVTICTYRKVCILGEIMNAEPRLNKYGNPVSKCWLEIPYHFPNAAIDTFVVMPNHFHGIVVIQDCRGEVASPAPRGAETAPLRRHTLGQIMAYFKYQSTKAINQIRHTPGARLWQRNYYEHVIRNEHDLNDIRQYILDNPVKWDMDEENPKQQPFCHNERNLQGEPICLTR